MLCWADIGIDVDKIDVFVEKNPGRQPVQPRIGPAKHLQPFFRGVAKRVRGNPKRENPTAKRDPEASSAEAGAAVAGTIPVWKRRRRSCACPKTNEPVRFAGFLSRSFRIRKIPKFSKSMSGLGQPLGRVDGFRGSTRNSNGQQQSGKTSARPGGGPQKLLRLRFRVERSIGRRLVQRFPDTGPFRFESRAVA